jgi:spheroidene monooxygenase
MALARPALARDKRLSFAKLCGAGSGAGFTFRLDGRMWAIMATWPDEATARDGLATSPVWRRWRARAAESYSVLLSPVSSRGSWSGVNPFTPQTDTPGPDGRWAALTRATLKPRHLLHFWDHVPGVQDRIAQDPAVAFKIGIGEVPLVHQVTFSVWPDLASMASFARREGAHALAIEAVRSGDWFAEELYARFRILGTQGTWGGFDPLGPPAAPERKAA